MSAQWRWLLTSIVLEIFDEFNQHSFVAQQGVEHLLIILWHQNKQRQHEEGLILDALILVKHYCHNHLEVVLVVGVDSPHGLILNKHHILRLEALPLCEVVVIIFEEVKSLKDVLMVLLNKLVKPLVIFSIVQKQLLNQNSDVINLRRYF